MLVTIYSDASIKNNGTATYAYRAKCNYSTISGRGLITESVGRSSNKAEHFAIRAAIKSVMKKWKDAKVYFINTDSLQCCVTYWRLDGLKGRGGKSKDIQDEVQKVIKYFKKNNLIIRLKHVKGHTGKKDIRSVLNNWCDQNT